MTMSRVRLSGRAVRAVLKEILNPRVDPPAAERSVAAAGPGGGQRPGVPVRAGASGVGASQDLAMVGHDGHIVSAATILRMLRDEGPILAADYQRERRRRLAERRKAAFAADPNGSNQVWQLDLSEFETTSGGTWRLAGCRDYWSKYEHRWHVSPTANQFDAIAAIELALTAVIESIASGVPALKEVRILDRTLTKRAVDVLAYFDRPGTGNGDDHDPIEDATAANCEPAASAASAARNIRSLPIMSPTRTMIGVKIDADSKYAVKTRIRPEA